MSDLDNSDLELWHRNPCTRWILAQLVSRFDHTENWTRAETWEKTLRLKGQQDVVDWFRDNTTPRK